jgi:hypothetical protein
MPLFVLLSSSHRHWYQLIQDMLPSLARQKRRMVNPSMDAFGNLSCILLVYARHSDPNILHQGEYLGFPPLNKKNPIT